jgi:hypothetical protein
MGIRRHLSVVVSRIKWCGRPVINRLRRNLDRSKVTSRSFVLRRQGPGMKEVSKVQHSCLARGETEAVEIDLDMSTAMSRASWLIGTGPSQGEVRFN